MEINKSKLLNQITTESLEAQKLESESNFLEAANLRELLVAKISNLLISIFEKFYNFL